MLVPTPTRDRSPKTLFIDVLVALPELADGTATDTIGKALQALWTTLHDESVDTKLRLSLVSRRFEEVINKIAVVFEQGADGPERGLDALSDGQQSLFYFALAAAVFDVEWQLVTVKVRGCHKDQLRIPALSIFALEEPENHLSPFFLSHVVRQVRSLTVESRAQAVITSHSSAVIGRGEPQLVRYCRYHPATRVSFIKPISLPADATESASSCVAPCMPSRARL
jgi:putative ATP-dependent endonuclease of the OLD family